MEDQYDFSKAERGKFHRPGAKLNLPVCPEEEVRQLEDQRKRIGGKGGE